MRLYNLHKDTQMKIGVKKSMIRLYAFEALSPKAISMCVCVKDRETANIYVHICIARQGIILSLIMEGFSEEMTLI